MATTIKAQNEDKVPDRDLTLNVVPAEITTEMQRAYLDYAMSVIVSRALPDVRDGLKPVQRRIIYAMQDQGMSSTAKFHKSAAVVGEVLKSYHPHGDTSVYDAMVRMAQEFTLRYPLVFGQGNFGSVDGDPPAAMRYTEAKLQKIAEELYRDIDRETVEFELNDLQNMEPRFLPSLLPNILLNGASGIAVGMATNIPPHNLGEVVDGINLLIDKADNVGKNTTKDDEQEFCAFDTGEGVFKVKVAKPEFKSEATVEDLVQFIKGPDFPTGGTIYDQKELTNMYATGKGRVVTRAKMIIEETKAGKMRILVTEIPYQINKATLLEKIADLVKEKKIEGISDLRDESNREGMRIVIELKKEALPQQVQNRLYKFTSLQSTFNTNLVALLDGEPKLMTLKTVLEEFVKHRQIIVVKRTIHLLKRAKAREHILQGLKKAIDIIDEIIALIKKSPDADKAKEGLIKQFEFSSIQAQAILDMQLRKLAALERHKIEEELKDILKIISGFEELLASPKKIIETVKKELLELKERFADDRKTKVVKGKIGELSDEDLVAEENCIITISDSGYIKRLKLDTYKKQGRGGKGVKGQELKDEDIVSTIRTCNTHDWAFFFTNKGRVYKMRVWEIPESSRRAKGTALVNFLNITQEEKVQAFLSMDTETLENEGGYVVFATEKGVIKKTSIADYENIRTSGIAAIKLAEGDNLTWARTSKGNDEIIMITSSGQSIRFSEKDVRPMGRVAAGVTGIKMKDKSDWLVGMVVVNPKAKGIELAIVSEKGYGKKTALAEYRLQNRGGSGIRTYKVTDKTGDLVNARIHDDNSVTDLLIVTASGNVIRVGSEQIPSLGRDTSGVRLIRLDDKDKVASVAEVVEGEDVESEE
ncbi:DNA gyrase subunit A [candidate division WWE3 bacterium]|nr:DNA gyrase subunit A [candidate division WWE3 bacterium]